MSDDNDLSGRELEDCGLRWDAARQSIVWEEMLDYDPDSEWCREIDRNIKALDDAFLQSCGVKRIDSNE